MTELEKEELERNLTKNDCYKEDESANDTGNNLRSWSTFIKQKL